MHGCQEDESHTITIDAGAAGACDGMCVSEVGDCISLMVDDRNHSSLIDKLTAVSRKSSHIAKTSSNLNGRR